MQSGALDENLLPDVPTFEVDPDDDSDEEVLFAKAMPITARKRRSTAAVASAMIDMNGFQVNMSSAAAKAAQKQIIVKPKVPEILKEPAVPDDRSVFAVCFFLFVCYCFRFDRIWFLAFFVILSLYSKHCAVLRLMSGLWTAPAKKHAMSAFLMEPCPAVHFLVR